jgi:hypothetical protein
MFALMSITSIDMISMCVPFPLFSLSLSHVHSHLIPFTQYLRSRNHGPLCLLAPSCSPSLDARVHEPLSAMPSVKLARSFLLSNSYLSPFPYLGCPFHGTEDK